MKLQLQRYMEKIENNYYIMNNDKNNELKYLGFHLVGSVDDIAFRSYYLYLLMNKLVIQSKVGIFESISLPVTLFSTIISIILTLTNKIAINIIIFIYAGVMLLLIGLLVYEKIRNRESNVIDDELYLFIHIDQMLKYSNQLRLIEVCRHNKDEITDTYLRKILMLLIETKKGIEEYKAKLIKKGVFPNCLIDFGCTHEYMNEKMKDANDLISRIDRQLKGEINETPTTKKEI